MDHQSDFCLSMKRINGHCIHRLVGSCPLFRYYSLPMVDDVPINCYNSKVELSQDDKAHVHIHAISTFKPLNRQFGPKLVHFGTTILFEYVFTFYIVTCRYTP